MLEFTGIDILAREKPGQKGWDPRFGVWRPRTRKISDEAPQTFAPITPQVQDAAAREVPDLSILWRGPKHPADSMGVVTHQSLAALMRLGRESSLSFAPLEEWPEMPAPPLDPRLGAVSSLPGSSGEEDLEIQMPGLVAARRPRCLRFLFHEFGNFPSIAMQEEDVLWAPSQLVQKKMRGAYPGREVIVAPHGVDQEVFRPEGTRYFASGSKFRFLYVGTTISRKGIDLVLQAFDQCGLDGVELILKISPTSSGFIWDEVRKHRPGVKVLDRPLSPMDMASLLRSCQLLLAPARAEGFGLPVLEAMACGLPPAIPAGGAMDDFCPPSCRYTIAAEEVQIPIAGKDLTFLEPDPTSLVQVMREARDNPEDARIRGAAAAEAARPFTWEAAVKMALLQEGEVTRARR